MPSVSFLTFQPFPLCREQRFVLTFRAFFLPQTMFQPLRHVENTVLEETTFPLLQAVLAISSLLNPILRTTHQDRTGGTVCGWCLFMLGLGITFLSCILFFDISFSHATPTHCAAAAVQQKLKMPPFFRLVNCENRATIIQGRSFALSSCSCR